MKSQGREANLIGSSYQVSGKDGIFQQLLKKGYRLEERYESPGGKSFWYDIYRGNSKIGAFLGETQVYNWFKENHDTSLRDRALLEDLKPSSDIYLILNKNIKICEAKTQRQAGSTFMKASGNYDVYMDFFGKEFKKKGYSVQFNYIVNDFILDNYKYYIRLLNKKKNVTFCNTIQKFKI